MDEVALLLECASRPFVLVLVELSFNRLRSEPETESEVLSLSKKDGVGLFFDRVGLNIENINSRGVRSWRKKNFADP